MVTTAFSHHLNVYPPFASQILFELWKTNNTEGNKEEYLVKMIVNDEVVELKGACNNQMNCTLDNFISYIKTISFYGDD